MKKNIYFSKIYQLRFHEKNYHMLSSWWKDFSCRGLTSKCSNGRKTDVKKWKLLRKDQSILEIKKEYQFFFLSTPATGIANGNSSQSKRKIWSSGRDWKSFEIGCNRKISYEKDLCIKSVSEQSISCKEKWWGQSSGLSPTWKTKINTFPTTILKWRSCNHC